MTGRHLGDGKISDYRVHVRFEARRPYLQGLRAAPSRLAHRDYRIGGFPKRRSLGLPPSIRGSPQPRATFQRSKATERASASVIAGYRPMLLSVRLP